MEERTKVVDGKGMGMVEGEGTTQNRGRTPQEGLAEITAKGLKALDIWLQDTGKDLIEEHLMHHSKVYRSAFDMTVEKEGDAEILEPTPAEVRTGYEIMHDIEDSTMREVLRMLTITLITANLPEEGDGSE
jgi:hypothetical protein